ncbi:MAG: hypothetical protein ACREIA_12510 [Opitutaceae bacterium]
MAQADDRGGLPGEIDDAQLDGLPHGRCSVDRGRARAVRVQGVPGIADVQDGVGGEGPALSEAQAGDGVAQLAGDDFDAGRAGRIASKDLGIDRAGEDAGAVGVAETDDEGVGALALARGEGDVNDVFRGDAAFASDVRDLGRLRLGGGAAAEGEGKRDEVVYLFHGCMS